MNLLLIVECLFMLPLRKIFAPRGRSRKLEKIAQCVAVRVYSPNIMWAVKIKEGEVGGACGTHGEEKWLRTFCSITKVKKSLERRKFRLKDNIQMDPKETRRV